MILRKILVKLFHDSSNREGYAKAIYYIRTIPKQDYQIAEDRYIKLFSTCSRFQFKIFIKELNKEKNNALPLIYLFSAIKYPEVAKKFWPMLLRLDIKDILIFLSRLKNFHADYYFTLKILIGKYSIGERIARLKSSDPLNAIVPLELRISSDFHPTSIWGSQGTRMQQEVKKWHERFNTIGALKFPKIGIDLTYYKMNKIAFSCIDKNPYTKNELETRIRFKYYDMRYTNFFTRSLFKYFMPWTKESTEYYNKEMALYANYFGAPMYKRELQSLQEKVNAERSNNLVPFKDAMIDSSRLTGEGGYIKEQSDNEKLLQKAEVLDAQDLYDALKEDGFKNGVKSTIRVDVHHPVDFEATASISERAKLFDESVKAQALSNKAKFFKFYDSAIADSSILPTNNAKLFRLYDCAIADNSILPIDPERGELAKPKTKKDKNFGWYPAQSESEKDIKKTKSRGLLDTSSDSDDAEEILGGPAYSKSLSKS